MAHLHRGWGWVSVDGALAYTRSCIMHTAYTVCLATLIEIRLEILWPFQLACIHVYIIYYVYVHVCEFTVCVALFCSKVPCRSGSGFHLLCWLSTPPVGGIECRAACIPVT